MRRARADSLGGVPGCTTLTDSPDLTEADLTEADLRDANLTRANLTRADLTEADLRGVRGTTEQEVRAVAVVRWDTKFGPLPE
ncbi:pentapeptide repeat-containing protein [Nonomuraea recticatena]|uniref:pentapeptide repeat-containing protein n=1 Tax=Nonomuraea recticatena TaxID=46178 RepID=UPI0036062DF9